MPHKGIRKDVVFQQSLQPALPRGLSPTPRVTAAVQIDLCHFYPKAPCGAPHCLRIEADLSPGIKVLGELVCAHPCRPPLPPTSRLVGLSQPFHSCTGPAPGDPPGSSCFQSPQGAPPSSSLRFSALEEQGQGGGSRFPHGICF